jgi:hypothetical protein
MRFDSFTRFPITIDGETAAIGSASELAVSLDVLKGQRDREILNQLRPHLAEIIANPAGLMLVLKSLSLDDQLFLLKAIGPDLGSVLQSAQRLRDQLATMADQEVEEALLLTLGQSGLQDLIFTAEELGEVLEWVYGQCDALLLDLLGLEYVRSMCRQPFDLSAILRSLDHDLQEKLLEHLGWEFVAGLVDDGPGLASLLRSLPPDSSQRLLTHFNATQLKTLIGNAEDWIYLYQRLEPEEADFLVNLLSEK